MLRLAGDGIFSFSVVPLHMATGCGIVLLVLSAVEVVYVLSFWITGRTSGLVPGWSSLMFVVLVTAAVNMMILGFIGIYVGMIFHEIKQRPVYIVKQDATCHEPPAPR
jgi:dolichol-phosphate mannosyltransferase